MLRWFFLKKIRKWLWHSGVLCLLGVVCVSSSFSQGFFRIEPAQYHEVTVTTGTGFFVTPSTIVTNNHVVEHCRDVWVRGAVPPTKVSIKAIDKNKDLAILISPRRAPRIAFLRANDGLKKGDGVTVIGYPLERGLTGIYRMVKATILNVDKTVQGIQNIEFTQSVEQGNSGGPLLDRAGNIIGVVVGKMHYYHSKQLMDHDRPFKISGLAIGLPVLKAFLRQHGIFVSGQSTYDVFNELHPDERAEKYLVNIICVEP